MYFVSGMHHGLDCLRGAQKLNMFGVRRFCQLRNFFTLVFLLLIGCLLDCLPACVIFFFVSVQNIVKGVGSPGGRLLAVGDARGRARGGRQREENQADEDLQWR